MKGWTLINTYGRIHQAELRKTMLEDYGVNAVIVNEKDSAFLLGDIELWVEDGSTEKAHTLLAEFEGWSKVDSFISSSQLERLEEQLKKENIEAKILKREKYFASLPEYELFVKSGQVEAAKNIFSSLENWTKIAGFETVLQAAYRVLKLEENDIETIVFNKRDDNFQIIEVELFVRTDFKVKALELTSSFEGWEIADSFTNKVKAELAEAELEKNNIEFIEFQRRNEAGEIQTIELFVKSEKREDAKTFIDQRKSWSKVKSFEKMYNAQLYSEILSNSSINNVIISSRDHAFLLGEMYLYVEDDDLEKANELITEFEKTEAENFEELE